jgi:hypothetical protein
LVCEFSDKSVGLEDFPNLFAGVFRDHKRSIASDQPRSCQLKVVAFRFQDTQFFTVEPIFISGVTVLF